MYTDRHESRYVKNVYTKIPRYRNVPKQKIKISKGKYAHKKTHPNTKIVNKKY